jgi:phosphohistidine swiveling domain-containing protein
MGHKHDMAKLYLTQKSLSEWLEDIKHPGVESLRHEDNNKRERLRKLNAIIGLPFDAPVQFMADDIANNTPAHKKYVQQHGNELCALRLIPLEKSLPKLRMRGMTVSAVQQWFKDQSIDPSLYRADYIQHSDKQTWSTIFVIGKNGIYGEIIRGSHTQLTQGFYDEDNWPHTFFYDFSSWHIEPYDKDVQPVLERIIKHLRLPITKQERIAQELEGTFSHNYLQGYFETTESKEFGLWFIDYSPELGSMLGAIGLPQKVQNVEVVSGQVACPGQVKGTVRLVGKDGVDDAFPEGAILVCPVTTPDFVPLMKKAAAIVTDTGGILSHAAIVARELQKPCIVGTKNASGVLREGEKVFVDADKGIVKRIN